MKKFTPAEARVFCEANPDMSLAAQARECGLKAQTLRRWKGQGFKDVKPRGIPKTKEEKELRAEVRKAFIEGRQTLIDVESGRLAALPDDDLLKESARQMMVTMTLVLKETSAQTARLVTEMPVQTGSLIDSATNALKAGHESWESMMNLRNRVSVAAPAEPTAAKLDDDDPQKGMGDFLDSLISKYSVASTKQ
jgi:hypothetical protein